MERVESGLRVVIAFNEAFNRHDVPGMMQLITEDCVFEDTYPPPDGTLYKGKPAIARYWQGFFDRSPRAHIQIEKTFGYGLRCVTLWRYDWVDENDLPGHVRGVDIYEVRNGLISEKLSYVKG
jgi:predicted SnoaL-like aldol condensation-catalyzing enzyme